MVNQALKLAGEWLKRSEDLQREAHQLDFTRVEAMTLEACARSLIRLCESQVAAQTPDVEFTKAATEVLEQHAETFKRLAESEMDEAYEALSQHEQQVSAPISEMNAWMAEGNKRRLEQVEAREKLAAEWYKPTEAEVSAIEAWNKLHKGEKP